MPQNYPNPAQHLRSIGASVGDRMRCPDHAKPAILCYIGNNYALLEMPDGTPFVARPSYNITNWKIAPKPLFTRDVINLGLGSLVAIRYNGRCIGSVRPGPMPVDVMDMPRIKQVFDTLLDAGLAHLNENPPEHEPPKDSAEPPPPLMPPKYSASVCGDIYRDGVLIGRFAKSNSRDNDDEKIRFIEGGLAHLNGSTRG